jgi:hypothetical protein
MNPFHTPLPSLGVTPGEPPLAAPTPPPAPAFAREIAEAAAPLDLEPAWQESSFDLRSGADITDFSDTIPSDVFHRLFKA